MTGNTIIKSAKLTKGTDPDPNFPFIGYVKLTDVNGTSGTSIEGIEFMYFRGYDIQIVGIGGPTLDWETINVDGTEYEFRFKSFSTQFPAPYYYFNVANLRIPIDLDYQLIHPEPAPSDRYQYISLGKKKAYSGMALLNIRNKPITGSGTKETGFYLEGVDGPGSIPENSFVPIGFHYGEKPSEDTGECVPLSDDSDKGNGKFGCKTVVGFDQKKIPLFAWDEEITPDGVKTYLMLALGTDQSSGFCATMKETEVDNYINTSLNRYGPGQCIGLKITRPMEYVVEGFQSAFGIHIVSDYDYGWDIGSYCLKKYFT